MNWLDIIFAITAGKARNLLSLHPSIIASGSGTKLEAYIGCEIWVMFQIGRIAASHEYRTQALQEGQLNCAEAAKLAAKITGKIRYGLVQTGLKGLKMPERVPPTTPTVTSDMNTLVTELFAYTAVLYLHSVIYGFQKLETVDRTIFESDKHASDSCATTSSTSFGLSALHCWMYGTAQRQKFLPDNLFLSGIAGSVTSTSKEDFASLRGGLEQTADCAWMFVER